MKLNLTSLWLTVVISSVVASGDTVTLNPVADVRILSDNYGDVNFESDILSTYNATGNIQRTLIQFDLSGVPDGSTINSATLRLYGYAYFGNTSETNIWVYRATTPWVEGEVTWNIASTGNPWTHPGGDLVGTDGTYFVNPYTTWSGDQPYPPWEWLDPDIDVTELVIEHYLDIHPNYGIGLAGPVDNQLVYVSREGPLDFPELVIDYTPNGEPPSCDGDANGDHVVDPLDSGYVLSRFGCDVGSGDADCDAADQNGDGIVDPLDVGFVLARFGECP